MPPAVSAAGLAGRCVDQVFVRQAEDTERREKNLDEAKKIIIENDSSLPCPETVGPHTLNRFSRSRVSESLL